MTKQTVVMLLAVMVLMGSGISLYRGCRPPSMQIQSDVLQVCGEVAGEATVTLLGGKGRVVVLRLSDDRLKSIQALRLKGFERALKSHGEVEIIAVKDVIDSEKSVDDVETEIIFPMRSYREMIEMYPDADAMVCLAGNPFSSSSSLDGWPENRPKCVLLEIIPAGAHELVTEGVVDIAFVLCQSPTPASGMANSPREWFDRMYEVVTRNNYVAP